MIKRVRAILTACAILLVGTVAVLAVKHLLLPRIPESSRSAVSAVADGLGITIAVASGLTGLLTALRGKPARMGRDTGHTPPRPPRRGVLPELGPLPPGSRVPFTRNALFTGRREPLLSLARSLLHTHSGPALITQAVTGMGGAGKTQLAVEFAYRYGRYFEGVHWLDAKDPLSIPAQIAACGLAMTLPDWPKEQPEQVARTLAAWRKGGPRPVILDNIEDVTAAREWLPQLAGPHLRLLLTARRSGWPPDLGLETLSLHLFSADESRTFLRRTLPPPRASDVDLDLLAERLGHLPLALELAARYLRAQPRLTVGQYSSSLDSVLDDPAMKPWRAELGGPTGHDLDLAATFLLSWSMVSEEPARRVFLVCGFCAPNRPIPRELLQRACGLDRDACDGALSLLSNLSLLTVDGTPAVPGTDTASDPLIHPLLAEFARSLAEAADEADFWPLLSLTDALSRLCFTALEAGLPARFYPLRPHLEAVLPVADSAGDALTATLWSHLGYHLSEVADYERARSAYERTLAIEEHALGPDHTKVATTLNNLGLVLCELGDLPAARAAVERALAIDERALGPEDSSVASEVNNLGSLLWEMHDLEGARAAFERALGIFTRVHGEHHPMVAAALNNIALILQEQDDLSGAQAALERALAIDRAAKGENHPDVANAINNLGSVRRDLGDFEGARQAFERALAIWTQVYGPEHPQVAIAYNNLGRVLQQMGDLAGARAALERSLAIFEAVLPPGHSDIARVRAKLDELG